jgi:hypothetical protein
MRSPRPPEPILAEVFHYLQYLKSQQSDDRFNGVLANESVLARDWLTPEEDAAWESL